MSFNVSYIANNKLGIEDVGKNANGVDIQRIDVEALEEKEEFLPVNLKNRDVVVTTLVNETLTDGHIKRLYIDMSELRRFKSYDFLVFNDSVNDLRMSIIPSTSASSVAAMHIVMEDGSFSRYGTGSSDVYHTIPARVRGVLLSHVPATD